MKSTVDPAALKLVDLGSGSTRAVQVVQPDGGLASLDCIVSNCGPPEVGAGWQVAALPGVIEDDSRHGHPTALAKSGRGWGRVSGVAAGPRGH